jgi:hypothetical protein
LGRKRVSDASELLDKTKLLRDMADESFDSDGQDLLEDVVAGLMDLVDENKQLKAEIHRLTPKPMTLKEACEVLNKNLHDCRDNWFISPSREHLLSESGKQMRALASKFAIAIASVYVAEQEAVSG